MTMLDGENIQGILGVMVPIVAIVGGISVALASMYMRSKERMEMISRGIDVSKVDWPRRRRNPLRSGLTVLGAGAGLLTAYILCHAGIIGSSDDEHTVIYVAFVLVFVGIARVLSHLLEKNNPTDNGNIQRGNL